MTTPRCRVLCVDDNDDTCFMLRTLLGTSGYEVETADGVGEALRLARTSHFDLYVIDNRYPDGTGADLCRRLREASPDTPVVVYSGAAYGSDRDEALDAGATRYVVKPAIDELLETVKQLLVPEHCATSNAA